MSVNTARGIAWSLVGLYVILGAAGLWPVTGALVVSRHPRHPVGWLMCLGVIVGPIDMFTAGYTAYNTYEFSGSLPGADLALIWLTVGGMPFGILAFTLATLLFPDGKFPSAGWHKVTWTAVGGRFWPTDAGSKRRCLTDKRTLCGFSR